jgi:GrpB-like predicted nucleotidyltransferase (UPF0157 family)
MPLHLAPYDPRWAIEFTNERDRIARALGPIAHRIDHHGSTAVPGLDAKPTIDIQVSVDRLLPLAAYAAPLATIGYLHRPSADDGVCPFFHRPAEWPHTHHVHVVEFGGAEERRTLAFRDFLRAHDEVAHEYLALKKELARQTDPADPASREAYANAKTSFVERIVQRALAEGYLHRMADGR